MLDSITPMPEVVSASAPGFVVFIGQSPSGGFTANLWGRKEGRPLISPAKIQRELGFSAISGKNIASGISARRTLARESRSTDDGKTVTEKPHPANVLQETIGQLTELAEEIALQIPRAAAAADVTIDYATPREHDDPVQLIARELVGGSQRPAGK